MADRITLRAPAKINLFLDITARQENGYHSLNSLMQQISLSDTLTVIMDRSGDDIALSTDHGGLVCDENNLVCRAARGFFSALGHARSLSVYLEKEIPMQAGLGGGSADCAAMLHALNRLCGMPFSTEELCQIGTPLGADVPFCIAGGTQRAEGIGEKLFPLPPMQSCFIVVAMGKESMPTPAAFKALDRIYDGFTDRLPRTKDYERIIASLTEDLSVLARGMYNIFEDAVLPALPVLRDRLDLLLRHGALGARMSGSGAAVFGIFAEERDAARAAEALRSSDCASWICQPIQGAESLT